MANDYSRRSNTDGYQTRIQRRINLGEDLLQIFQAVIEGIEDLTEREKKVAEWLTANREAARLIYSDGSIIEELPTTTGIDLAELSHQDIHEQLVAIVSEQIKKLGELVQETRAWDGMERVPA
jgi:hypothetical protein